ncbi:MAG TPA: efflux RND transporter periplasmic adaptor subunit [Sandaracinaceae bacterium]
MRRWWKRLAVVSALGALAALFAMRAVFGPSVESVPVRRARVTQTVLVSGRVLPPAEVELTARIEAPVVEVLVDEGDVVQQGQVLARLDRAAAEAEAARARAVLARAEATLGRTRRIAPLLAQERLSSARVQRIEAERNLAQARALAASGALAPSQLSAAEDAFARSESAARAAEIELTATRGSERLVASAGVDEARAALRLAEERLAHSTVSAPLAGTVLARNIEVGDTARPGAVLFRLAVDGEPRLLVEPDERFLAQLAIGQRAIASADAFPDRTFGAQVSFIAPSIDPERGTVEVRLSPTEPVPYLRPNMTVSVEIQVGEEADALVVPTELVHDSASDAPWVWIEEGGVLVRREVQLGLRGDEDLQILGGLVEGQRVLRVTDPRLRSGSRVRVEGG